MAPLDDSQPLPLMSRPRVGRLSALMRANVNLHWLSCESESERKQNRATKVAGYRKSNYPMSAVARERARG